MKGPKWIPFSYIKPFFFPILFCIVMGTHFFLATISRSSLSIFKTLFSKHCMHDNVVLVVYVFAYLSTKTFLWRWWWLCKVNLLSRRVIRWLKYSTSLKKNQVASINNASNSVTRSACLSSNLFDLVIDAHLVIVSTTNVDSADMIPFHDVIEDIGSNCDYNYGHFIVEHEVDSS